MKRVKFFPVILLLALTALLAVSVYGLKSAQPARAQDTVDYGGYNSYSLYFKSLDVTYEVAENRKIAVTEILTVHFTGTQSTGFIKDIPTNGGELIRNVKVSEMSNGVYKNVPYSLYYEDSGFLSVDIGDTSLKTNKTFTYVITYDYCLTKSQEGKNALHLNAIGTGRDAKIENASVTIITPKGYIDSVCRVGLSEETGEWHGEVTESRLDDGRTKLSVKDVALAEKEGVTIEMNFEDGVLSNYFEFTPYWFLIAELLIFAAIVLLKLFVFNKNRIMPVVNYEAPYKMDPLKMGKLIDNSVDGEDVTSLIYYWASKGFIKINLDDKKDPVLIRIRQTLPDDFPSYQKVMYNSLFLKGDMIQTSSLKNSFYKVVAQVSALVNGQNKNLYDSKSKTFSLVLAVIGGFILGLAPFLISILQISGKLLSFFSFFTVVPAVALNILMQTVMFNRHKFKKLTFILCCLGLTLLGAFIGLFYVFLVPSGIIGVVPKILIYASGVAVWLSSVLIISRTKEYNDTLNEILGFKNFIKLAEKDQLEMMLEEDPQYYYNILPYAQVLGVSSIWEEKFQSLTVEPPQWLTGNMVSTYIEFRIISGIINSSLGRMSSDFVSRPSSSGSSGRGGFGGGHVGGGHGGGGFRGR